MLPLRGPGAAYAASQARQPGDATTPAELSDLISSIAEIGVLHPILVEERPGKAHGRPAMSVVTGERRLRACRWGAVHLPDNPNFDAIPAIISPGPGPARRVPEVAAGGEPAREPLRPGEQAAALLLHRCAILTGKLLRAGVSVPAEVYDIEDPVERFTTLEKIRGGNADCAAPWAEVLTRLGLQLTPRKARQIVRAFAELPRELSAEMDEHQVALHTRIRFAQLRQGRAEAASQIWAAVKDGGRRTCSAAVQAGLDDPRIDPGKAVEAADALHQAANASRSQKLSKHPATRSSAQKSAAVSAAITALRDLAADLRTGVRPAGLDAARCACSPRKSSCYCRRPRSRRDHGAAADAPDGPDPLPGRGCDCASCAFWMGPDGTGGPGHSRAAVLRHEFGLLVLRLRPRRGRRPAHACAAARSAAGPVPISGSGWPTSAAPSPSMISALPAATATREPPGIHPDDRHLGDHGSRRELHWPAYAVGLRRVFSPASHQIVPRFAGTTARDALHLADDQLAVLAGYGEDPLVEAFWTSRHRLIGRSPNSTGTWSWPATTASTATGRAPST